MPYKRLSKAAAWEIAGQFELVYRAALKILIGYQP
jgi:hypothetical protein